MSMLLCQITFGLLCIKRAASLIRFTHYGCKYAKIKGDSLHSLISNPMSNPMEYRAIRTKNVSLFNYFRTTLYILTC